jgi:tRNA-dihydrouridine synthase A
MLDWTDRHCRFFHRLLTKHALLYTEMVTTGALLHGDRHRFLQFDSVEHPLALQLGGSDPADLALCAKMAEEYGYDEINLNVGCPSDRVQNGRFGACLMAEPKLVADCVAAMQAVVAIPVTVKSRVGIDHHDSYEELAHFIQTVASAGCRTFIIHARKAWLNGLSPKQNREIPSLRYEWVFQLKRDYPALEVIINGGITSFELAEELLLQVDGVMMGRAAYQNPFLLADVDRRFFSGACPSLSREEAVERMVPYIRRQLKSGARLNSMARHLLGLFHNRPYGKAWRRYLSEHACQADANENVIYEALKLVRQ